MNLILAALSMVSCAPAFYLGMKAVVALDLPFVTGFLPVYVCLGLCFYFIKRAEADL